MREKIPPTQGKSEELSNFQVYQGSHLNLKSFAVEILRPDTLSLLPDGNTLIVNMRMRVPLCVQDQPSMLVLMGMTNVWEMKVPQMFIKVLLFLAVFFPRVKKH